MTPFYLAQPTKTFLHFITLQEETSNIPFFIYRFIRKDIKVISILPPLYLEKHLFLNLYFLNVNFLSSSTWPFLAISDHFKSISKITNRFLSPFPNQISQENLFVRCLSYTATELRFANSSTYLSLDPSRLQVQSYIFWLIM